MFPRRLSGNLEGMTDHQPEETTEEPPTGAEGGGPSEAPNPDQPDENTAPPSNPEPDPERVEQEQEDADRTIPS